MTGDTGLELLPIAILHAASFSPAWYYSRGVLYGERNASRNARLSLSVVPVRQRPLIQLTLINVLWNGALS